MGHSAAGAAQEGGARTGQQRTGHHRGGLRRPRAPRRSHRRRRVQPREPVLHLDPARVRAGVGRSGAPSPRSCRPSSRTLVVGDPQDEATDVSALISVASERDLHVVGWIDEAVAAGARVATGAPVHDGILLPTVLTDVTPDMLVCTEEGVRPARGGPALSRSRQRVHVRERHAATGCKRRSSRPIIAVAAAGRVQSFRLRWGAGQRGPHVPGRPRCPTAACATAATPARSPHRAVREMTETRLVVLG